MQGRLGIEMAVRVLENKLAHKHLGPQIKLLDLGSIESVGTEESLAPAFFTPTFVVE